MASIYEDNVTMVIPQDHAHARTRDELARRQRIVAPGAELVASVSNYRGSPRPMMTGHEHPRCTRRAPSLHTHLQASNRHSHRHVARWSQVCLGTASAFARMSHHRGLPLKVPASYRRASAGVLLSRRPPPLPRSFARQRATATMCGR